MAASQNWSACWPSDAVIEAELQDSSYKKVAAAHNIGHTVLRRHVIGEKRQTAGSSIAYHGGKNIAPQGQVPQQANGFRAKTSDATAEIEVTAATPAQVEKIGRTPDDLLNAANLNPEDWRASDVLVSTWDAQTGGGNIETLTSMKLKAVRVVADETALEHIFGKGNYQAGAKVAHFRHPRRRKTTDQAPRTAVLMSDPHTPFHDKALCEQLIPQLLRELQPEELDLLGDINDFPSVSRYKKNSPKHFAYVNECLQSSEYLLGLWSAAVPADTRKQWVRGNHDQRLTDSVMSNMPEVNEIRIGGVGTRILDLQLLMNADRSGWVEVTSEHGEYPQAEIEVLGLQNVIAVHGDTAKKGAGNTARDELYNDDVDLIFHGHDHRQAIIHRTTGRNAQIVKTAISVGHMSHNDGHGYAKPRSTDWQQGLSVFSLWPDGRYQVDLATYRNGALLFRGDRWTVGL